MQLDLKLKCLPLLLLILSPLGAQAAQAPLLPHVDEIPSGKSVFIADPKFAKDPFFPKSQRWTTQVVTPVGVVPDTTALNQVFNGLILKGISGLPGKRLALINNRTLETGEPFEFKINNRAIKVRCVEVRDKSVVIGIDGIAETKELHLRQGL